MSHPTNDAPKVRNELANFFTQETTQFFDDIDWLYYSVAHDSSMSPRGAIFLDNENLDGNFPANLNTRQTEYYIHVRLAISENLFSSLLDAVDVWAVHFKSVIIPKLQKEGFNGLFKGIHFDSRKSIVKEVEKNQDEGGTGYVHFFLVWYDQEQISGNYQDFLI